jgi:hypothetical protein
VRLEGDAEQVVGACSLLVGLRRHRGDKPLAGWRAPHTGLGSVGGVLGQNVAVVVYDLDFNPHYWKPK